jgi:LuxR family maltose regulon positive regulatory protein
VLILDDVHLLHSRGAVDVLHALCEQTPPRCTVVLAGRARPPLPLARLRAEGRLWELKAADLRMTPGEGAAMLRAAGVDVDDREAAIVVQRAEGWPAAIWLASLMLRAEAELGAGIALGPDEADLTEYFREEVLTGATPEDAGFLVRTSILDELRPVVCDAVLSREDSAVRLQALADADLFVAPVEAHGEVFRVHGLFREMLRAELHARDPAGERGLHRRACAAYAEAGDVDRAIRHAVDAGDLDVAGDLIATNIGDYVAHGRSATVRRWCSWFTEEQLAAHPQAALGRGWAAYESGEAADAAHCTAMALGGDRTRLLPDGSTLEGMGLTLRAALGHQGPAQLVADCEAALEGLAPDSAVRTIPLLLLGLSALLADDVGGARVRLEEAEHRGAGRLPTAYGLTLAHLALAAIEEERWDEAEALMSRATAQQRAAGVEHYASQGLVPAVRALLLVRRGERELAREEADRAALSLALLHVILPALGLETRLVLACAYAKLGDGGRARMLLREGLGIADLGPAPLLSRWAARVEEAIERAGTDPAAGPALTTAELRTLRYLPTHLSLKEIGERLYITRNTVKTHTISIYRKLEVTSRSGAVERGRDLGLLDR